VKPQKSPTKQDTDSPHPSPQRLEHEVPYTRSNAGSSLPSVAQVASTAPEKRQNVQPPLLTDSPNSNPKSQRQESSDNLKSFKVTIEDPTWKVLPAALKKYRINNESWKNYAMFICYGSSGKLQDQLEYIIA